MKRRMPVQGEAETEVMPGAGAAAGPSAGPVVHNVVLGGGAAGQPVNLLELLMEESGGGDRTTLMEAPGRTQPTGRSNADLTMPMAAVGSAMAPKPSDFTAVLQAFQPGPAAAARMPTEPLRPRIEPETPSRPGGYTRPVEGPLDPSGSGHTQVMNLGDAMGTQVLASAEKPARLERSPELQPAETTLSAARRTNGPNEGPNAIPATVNMPGWVPWLLVVLAVELLAILIVLLMGLKH
jgi:hypothetical protein